MKNKNKKQQKPIEDAAVGEDDKRIITDPRFAKVHSDPRFQKVPKHKAKVAIDSRFGRMFTDKRFFTSSAPLDKRGKPKKQQENALRRYYRMEAEERGGVKEEDEDEKEAKKTETGVEEGSEESERSDDEEEPESSDDSLLSKSDSEEADEEEGLESDATGTTTDTDDEGKDVDMDVDADVEEEEVPVIEKETKRLAIVNMDWNHVKAVDLLMLLRSFLPKGGQILSVAVYPSEFGLKHMEEEAAHGPVGLFDDDKENDNSDDDEDEIDMEKLRAYEKSRLRYYYAVVECDSSATAEYLYKHCDGVELEKSSNRLDLRFIPDSMEFKHPPRDVATEPPAEYEALNFHTRALQHSNIPLSWDEDEPHRVKALKRKFNADQLAELEFKEFLASDESESDEDKDEDENGGPTNEYLDKKNKKRDIYRALLQSGDGSEEDDNEAQDMEVTFNTGLEDLSKQILEKKDKKSETVWETYLRKRKEKKKARKNRSKHSSDDESDDTDQEPSEQHPSDFFEEEPAPVKKEKVGRSRKENQLLETDKEAQASQAELELLLADDNGTDNNLKGYKIKSKKAKGKKVKEAINEDKIPDVDYDDPRFSALFKNPLFALDPTDPQFKRSAVYARQLAQKQQNGLEPVEKLVKLPKRKTLLSKETVTSEDEVMKSDARSSTEKHELSALVKSIKMKSKHVAVPSRVQGKK
ncbi:hypothetical protein Ancab_003132 [Ancistrocladus abbreviatus]